MGRYSLRWYGTWYALKWYSRRWYAALAVPDRYDMAIRDHACQSSACHFGLGGLILGHLVILPGVMGTESVRGNDAAT